MRETGGGVCRRETKPNEDSQIDWSDCHIIGGRSFFFEVVLAHPKFRFLNIDLHHNNKVIPQMM